MRAAGTPIFSGRPRSARSRRGSRYRRTVSTKFGRNSSPRARSHERSRSRAARPRCSRSSPSRAAATSCSLAALASPNGVAPRAVSRPRRRRRRALDDARVAARGGEVRGRGRASASLTRAPASMRRRTTPSWPYRAAMRGECAARVRPPRYEFGSASACRSTSTARSSPSAHASWSGVHSSNRNCALMSPPLERFHVRTASSRPARQSSIGNGGTGFAVSESSSFRLVMARAAISGGTD